MVNNIRAKGGAGGEIVENYLPGYGIDGLEYGDLPEWRKGREGSLRLHTELEALMPMVSQLKGM